MNGKPLGRGNIDMKGIGIVCGWCSGSSISLDESIEESVNPESIAWLEIL